MREFADTMRVVERAKAFGYRELANGAKLYGHVPHVAPEAWLHQVYAPLTDYDIVNIERALKIDLAEDVRQFLSCANGLGLFSLSLSLYGKKQNYTRTGDEAWQPFCVISANTVERPSHARPEQLVIGGYQDDGSLLLLDNDDGTISRTKSRSKKVLNHWGSFRHMLASESIRLSELFDDEGKLRTQCRTIPLPDQPTS